MKGIGRKLEEKSIIHKRNNVPLFEIGELYTYVKKRGDKVRIWTAVDRNRLRFAGFEVGDASSETLRKLWNNVQNL
jgi:IS1 family transposase